MNTSPSGCCCTVQYQQSWKSVCVCRCLKSFKTSLKIGMNWSLFFSLHFEAILNTTNLIKGKIHIIAILSAPKVLNSGAYIYQNYIFTWNSVYVKCSRMCTCWVHRLTKMQHVQLEPLPEEIEYTVRYRQCWRAGDFVSVRIYFHIFTPNLYTCLRVYILGPSNWQQ